jgi:hypothetical protein
VNIHDHIIRNNCYTLKSLIPIASIFLKEKSNNKEC